VEDQEDFSYYVRINDQIFHFREVTPKDFYLAQILRQADRGYFELAIRLLLNPEILDNSSIVSSKAAINWVAETLLDSTVLTVENWLEVAYHLCKQRWDSSVDWLENQPMSKITAMIDIVKRHAEEQEAEMKKSSRRKK
jgi:hypothetical protein